MNWLTLKSAFDTEAFFNRVFMIFPNADVWAKLAALLLALSTVLSFGDARSAPEPTRSWHIRRPLLALAWVCLGMYFVLPYKVAGVEVVNYRFIWLAAFFTGLGTAWPRAGWRRAVVGSLVLTLGLSYLYEVNRRFRQFDRETIGASRLIDRLGPRQTLVAPLKQTGTTSFPLLHPLREVQQLATVRHGGLPTTSFAETPMNWVHYRNGRDPMPAIYPQNWAFHPGLSRFDYVLLREPIRPSRAMQRLRRVARDGDWVLLAVCGSKVLPNCS